MSGWVQISVGATSFDLSEQRSGETPALSGRLFGLVDFLINPAGRRASAVTFTASSYSSDQNETCMHRAFESFVAMDADGRPKCCTR